MTCHSELFGSNPEQCGYWKGRRISYWINKNYWLRIGDSSFV